LSQPQQPENDYENYDSDQSPDVKLNGQVKTESQPELFYGSIEKDPLSDEHHDKNVADDAVVYTNLQSPNDNSHTVAPSEQLYVNFGQ